jgi:exodeoxyribonuclease V alpha subunit
MAEKKSLEKVTGSIRYVVFKAPDSDFCIIKIDGGVAVKANIPNVKEGTLDYTFSGKWVTDARYGEQFLASSYSVEEPEDIAGIERYLLEFCDGIGPVRAQEIVDKLRGETLKVLKKDPLWVRDNISGLTEDHGLVIKDQLIKAEGDEDLTIELMELLKEQRFSNTVIDRIKKRWGPFGPEEIRKNPYCLVEIKGIGFATADAFALKFGVKFDSEDRRRAGIEHFMRDVVPNTGSVCYPYDSVVLNVQDLLGVPEEMVEETVIDMLLDNYLYKSRLDNLFLMEIYSRERELADHIVRILCGRRVVRIDPRNLDSLAPDQTEALRGILHNRLAILTGAPGTGKTYLIQKLLEFFPERTTLLAAPTGKAAKRLEEMTGRSAVTIHRLLEPTFEGEGKFRFQINEFDKLKCTHLIIDEVSMLDNWLAWSLFQAIPNDCHVILVGDHYQLPSVGAGNVLMEMLSSGEIPSFELKTIKRQDEGYIVRACHSIKDGKFFEYSNEKDSDLLFIQRNTPEAVLNEVCRLAVDIPEKLGYDRMKQVQVLSALRERTCLSVLAINKRLQEQFTSEPPEGRVFNVGDKVIQTRNSELMDLESEYHVPVVNGDMGRVLKIDGSWLEIELDNPRRRVQVHHKVNDLQLAYAVSVHKFQGSEVDVVIIPIHRCLGSNVPQQNWFYTALSRAKKLCILVGDKGEGRKIIRRSDQRKRGSELSIRINSSIQRDLEFDGDEFQDLFVDG